MRYNEEPIRRWLASVETRLNKLEQAQKTDEESGQEPQQRLGKPGKGPDTGNYEFCWKVVRKRIGMDRAHIGYGPVTENARLISFPHEMQFHLGKWTKQIIGCGPYTAFDSLKDARAFASWFKYTETCVFLCLGKISTDRRLWMRDAGEMRTGFPKGTRFYDEIMLLEEIHEINLREEEARNE